LEDHVGFSAVQREIAHFVDDEDGWSQERGELSVEPAEVIRHQGPWRGGLYPLMSGNECHFLAADFDVPAAMLDALAYTKAAPGSRSSGRPTRLGWRG